MTPRAGCFQFNREGGVGAMPPRVCRSRGFTFMELIVASAIMATLALSLYTAMRIGFKARDRVLTAVGPARSAEIAIDMVRNDLESALPPRGVLAGIFLGQIGPEVQGTSGVQFYAVGNPPAEVFTSSQAGSAGTRPPSLRAAGLMNRQDPTSFGGIQRIELLVRAPSRPGGQGGDLVRRITRNLLAPTEPLPDEEILCRGVNAFNLRYFDGLQWHDEWDSTQFEDTLPMAIEMSIELTRQQDPSRPQSVTAYRASRTFFLPCRDEGALMTGATQ